MSELWSRPIPLVLLSLVLLWLLAWLPRRIVPGRGSRLLRCLVPAWRFFEQIEPVPALRYRVAPHGDDWGDWHEALTAPARTLGSLWLNAAGNLHLACESLVEQFVADLEENAELGRAEDELVAYRLLCALIEQRVRAALPPSPTLRYQFCLAEVEVEAEATSPLLFLSRVHAA